MEPAIFPDGMELQGFETEKPQSADRWLTTIMMIIVVVYGWMASVAFEPRFVLPNDAVSYLGWLEGSELREWREVQKPRFLAFAWIARELKKVENDIRLLGGFQEPPVLLIVVDEPNRYVVTEARIEIAESIAMAGGQLRKAFIKAWLLQTQPKEAIAAQSLFRLEAVSDALTAMLASNVRFGSAGSSDDVELPAPEAWIRFAASLDALCGSPWASLDLQGRCGTSKSVHPLSFRSLLAGMIWAVYRDTPPMKRLSLLRAWAAELTARQEEVGSPVPEELAAWRNWLRSEFNQVFPVEAIAKRAGFSDNERESLSQAAEKVAAAVGLNETTRPQVNFVFRSELLGPESADAAKGELRGARSYVVIDSQKGARLFPGDISLNDNDLAGLSAALYVWETCGELRAGDLLEAPIRAQRYLVVRSCAERAPLKSWAELNREGLPAFARARPQDPFVQVHREHLELAIRHRVLSKNTALSQLGKDVHSARVLGLERPTWRADVGAYEVLGAIEAIEWYRASGS